MTKKNSKIKNWIFFFIFLKSDKKNSKIKKVKKKNQFLIFWIFFVIFEKSEKKIQKLKNEFFFCVF